jgi:hypothetical protein
VADVNAAMVTLETYREPFGEMLRRKFLSRKFWIWVATVCAAAASFAAGQLTPQEMMTAIGVASAAYQIGEGLADSGHRV